MSPRLAFAIDAAYRAGRSTLAHFRTGTAVEFKGDATPVTVADRSAERLIREALAGTYPREPILGEEEGATGTGPDRWVIDPIDGTKSFVAGVPMYATLLAYEQDGVPTQGVCYFPALDEMLYAEAGGGAFLNGRPIRTRSTPTEVGAILCCGGLTRLQERGLLQSLFTLSAKAMALRTWCDAYGHALVASGRVDAMIDPVLSRWDIAAVDVIVREAGGKFTDFQGRPNPHSEAISSNGPLHDRILEAFAA
ncbi:MAG TPA: inositol monophosphatase family protein [Fimbriimonadaceae bacterium]|nr:inositol monophosphatase family protein [Fimbriimonadaceae bacterium]